MPLFRRKPRPVPPPSAELPSGEEIERSVEATLVHSDTVLKLTAECPPEGSLSSTSL